MIERKTTGLPTALALLLAALVAATFWLLSSAPCAYALEEGDYSYYISNDVAVLSKYNADAQTVDIPSSLGGYPVVRIGTSAFEEKTLTTVNFPPTLKEINAWAFKNCSHLAKADLPEGIERLGGGAFANCDSLTSLTIKASLQDCGAGTWEISPAVGTTPAVTITAGPYVACDNIATVTFESGLGTIPANFFAGSGFCGEMQFNENIVKIGKAAFKDCLGLRKVTFPGSLQEIGDQAFENNTLLESADLAEGIQKLGARAFANCPLLKSVKIPSSLEECGCSTWEYPEKVRQALPIDDIYKVAFPAGPFAACENLTQIEYAEGTTIVPSNMFAGCPALTVVTVPEGVITVGSGAFKYCKALETASFASTVTTIASSAFESDVNLSKADLPINLKRLEAKAFANCDLITSVTLPAPLETCTDATYKIGDENIMGGPYVACDGLTTFSIATGCSLIPQNTFAGCTGLTAVNVPSGIVKIGDGAFKYCLMLASASMPSTLMEMGNSVFAHDPILTSVGLPDSLSTMGNSVFESCGALESISIPDSVTKMGTATFKNDYALLSVHMPSTYFEIPSSTFFNCVKLVNVNLTDYLRYIRSYAFENCDALTSVTLPNGLVELESAAFRSCDLLQTVLMPPTVEKIGAEAFRDCDALTTLADSSNGTYPPAEIAPPYGVREIGSKAFSECDAMIKATLPSSVKKLGDRVFYMCSKLTQATLGANTTEIPESMFQYCYALDSIIIPYQTTTIKANAFSECTNLKAAYIPRTTETIISNAFSYSNILVIYGEAGTPAQTYANSKGIRFVINETPVSSITFNKYSLYLIPRKAETIVYDIQPANFSGEVIWKSTDESVAKVNATGEITAVGVGNALVRLSAGDKVATVNVTVANPVKNVSLNEQNLTLEIGRAFQLVATTTPADAGSAAVEWTSSSPAIASVDPSGRVSALSKGSATITATAKDGGGAKASCAVTVTSAATVVVSPEGLESKHPYESDDTASWTYTMPGSPKAIAVTFDSRTSVEDRSDSIEIYNWAGTLVGTYTGTQLAGQTVELEGDTVTIKLISDKSVNDWGFKVTEVSEIVRAEDISKAVIALSSTSYAYDGQPKTPSIVQVTLNGSILPADAYDVSYLSNVYPSVTAPAVVITGKAPYYNGSAKASFTINAADLSKLQVTLSPSTFAYDGTEKKPAVTVKTLSGVELPSSDYTVAYADNVASGTALASVTGIKPNCTGFTSLAFSISEPPVPSGMTNPFTDVNNKTDHKNDVLWLAHMKISEGWTLSNGTKEFRPYAYVARADMAAFLFRTARNWGVVDGSWTPSATLKTTFRDVDASTPHAREIWWLAEAGISTGWKVGYSKEFRPYQTVARQDMAAFLFRLAKLAGKGGASDSWTASSSSKSKFKDVSAYDADNHHDEVWWLAEKGVSTGWKVGTKYEFRGILNVSRCDMAAFIHRMDALV